MKISTEKKKKLYSCEAVKAIAVREILSNGYEGNYMAHGVMKQFPIVDHVKICLKHNLIPILSEKEKKILDSYEEFFKAYGLMNKFVEYHKKACAFDEIHDFDIRSITWVTSELVKFNEDKGLELEKTRNHHIGLPKEKYEGVVNFVSKKNYKGKHGPSAIYLFRDRHGNEFIWFSSGLFHLKVAPCGDTNVAVEETHKDWFHIKGTVKTHREYKNRKQTYLNRCKLEYLGESESPIDVVVKEKDQDKLLKEISKNPYHINMLKDASDEMWEMATNVSPGVITTHPKEMPPRRLQRIAFELNSEILTVLGTDRIDPMLKVMDI